MNQCQIIHILKNSKGFISGEVISRKLKISRAGIWKNIEELRKQGYIIEAIPRQGYRLKEVPDKLFAREIQDGLKTKKLGRIIYHHNSIESTMSTAFQLGMEGIDEGALVCAETQTKGKGRMGRHWVSPKGKGIYMSLILRPKMSPVDVAKLTLMTGVAICEAIRAKTDLMVDIKWPNDLLVGGKKIAGFLTEMNAEMERVNFIVVGIGINVNTSLAQLPNTGTSIKKVSGKSYSRVELVQEILISMEQWYLRVQKEGFVAMMERWRELSSTLGHKVEVREGKHIIYGKALDIDTFGGLVIRSDKGDLIKRMSGDVTLIS